MTSTSQDSTLIFYTHPNSRGRVARWMLEEIGVPYETKIVEYGAEMKGPAYLAINPMGKVPALQHRGHVVTENAAICAYLADAFPQAGLAPALNDPARADYYRWLFFVAGPLESAMMASGAKMELDPASAGHGRVEDVLNTLEGLLTDRAFVAGDRFTAADLLLSAYVGWYMSMKMIALRPAFEAYVARHRGRAAAVRATKIDDEGSAARASA